MGLAVYGIISVQGEQQQCVVDFFILCVVGCGFFE